jgi:5'-nucleotidase (lipoprotein e(P4) family)
MDTKTTLPLIIALFLFSACTPTHTQQVQIPDSDRLINATVWYQKSAEIRACYYQAYQLAEYKLTENLKLYNGRKPVAVVMDIDETILDNSPFEGKLIATGELYTKQNWKEWSDKAAAKALPGSVDFINFARSKGVAVILISNRKTDEKENTLLNLVNVGVSFDDTTQIFLRGKNVPSGKQSRRDQVSEKYEVILYIGDNLADYSSVFDERGNDLAIPDVDSMINELNQKFVILPNPMYGDWEGAIYHNDYTMPPATKRQLLIEALDK